jgi:cytoskeletal protein CcmA (bactofilin family)
MFNSKPSKPAQRPPVPAPTQAAPPPRPASAPQPEPAPRRQTAPSVIGKDLVLEGGVTGDGELQVDGVIRGDVKVSRLTIGETGRIDGTVSAELVEARGKVVGSITAKQIRLFATAHIEGDITHEQLAMETGASFQGRSLKFQRQAPPPQSQPAPPPSDVVRMSVPTN